MRREETERYFMIEQGHWCNQGRRAVVRAWIRRCRPLAPGEVHVDVGAFAGVMVLEMSGEGLSFGVEPSPEGLAMARRAGAASRLVRGRAEDLPLADHSAAVVTCMDVLEHIEDDRAALAELVRVTCPGGLIVITVPAFPFLFGEWDRDMGHYRRYGRRDLKRLLAGFPVEVMARRSINNVMFVPIVVYRCWRKIFPSRRQVSLEYAIPPAFINRLCYRTFVWAGTTARPVLPWGLSWLLVLRRA